MSEKLKLRKQIDKLTNKKAKLINKLKALNEWSDKFESVKTMPDKEADNIISKSCQNIVDEFTSNPQALKKQADVIVSSAAKAVFEENYLKMPKCRLRTIMTALTVLSTTAISKRSMTKRQKLQIRNIMPRNNRSNRKSP